MTTPKVKIPDRLKGEWLKAYSAFGDYCQMGVSRSLRKLHEHYKGQIRSGSGTNIPTQYLSTLSRWSSRNSWQERVEEYDLAMRTISQESLEKEVFDGAAKPANRIHKLKKLTEDIGRMIYATDDEFEADHPGHRPFLWLKESKIIGSGVAAREITNYRYNSAIIGDFRGLLDDLARETGGRKQLVDITSADNRITLAGAREELENLSLEDLAARYRDITHQ